MAYPVVEGTATSVDSDRSSTTFSMNLPTGITAGETLLAYVSHTANSDAISFPAGWTELFAKNTTSGFWLNAAIWIKKADGTESGTVSVTCTAYFICGTIYRISGAANPENEPPVVAWSSGLGGAFPPGGSTATVDSLNNHGLLGGPFGRYDRYLGLVSYHYAFDYSTISTYPDNYSNFTAINSTGVNSTNDCGLVTGHRNIQSVGEFFGRWVVFERANQPKYNTGLVIFPKERYDARSSGFPYINKVALSSDSQRSASTVFNLILPPTQPGDVLVAVTATHNAVGDTVTWPNGWTELYDSTDGGGSNALNSSCAWKIADGSDTQTIPLTVDDNPTCGIAFTVTNIPSPDPTVGDSFENSGANPGFATTASGGSITPAGGSDNYLWVGVYAKEDDNGTYASFPTNYDGRFVVKGDWPTNSQDTMIVVCHSNDETARTSLTSNSLLAGSSLASVSTQFVFKPGSFETDDWWYLNWRGKGRNGFM